MKTSRLLVAAAAALTAGAVLAGCSGSDSEGAKPDTIATPKGFDLPAGVTLTQSGTSLALGKPGTAVYSADSADAASSAVTVTVTRVAKGSIKDFTFFSLDDETKKSTPYYVRATVKNEGPAGLGGVKLPIFAHDSSNTNLPANDIVGSFKPCKVSTLPKSFLPGSTADVCLVYLIPRGRTLQSIDLQTGKTADAISWKQ